MDQKAFFNLKQFQQDMILNEIKTIQDCFNQILLFLQTNCHQTKQVKTAQTEIKNAFHEFLKAKKDVKLPYYPDETLIDLPVNLDAPISPSMEGSL